MSTLPPLCTQALSPALRTLLEVDLRFQHAAGTTLLRMAAGIACGATAWATWLGLRTAGTAPTLLPTFVAAGIGLAMVVLAWLQRRERTAALRAVLGAGQVQAVDGRLDTAAILPAAASSVGRLRAYGVDGVAHLVLVESPGSEALLGFVPQQVQGPAAGTPIRLVFSATRPGHLLQVEYPHLPAAPAQVAPMTAADWTGLMARPRALLQGAAWLGAAMLAGLVVLAFLPGVSRGFSAWLGAGLVVMLLWVLWLCLPELRMWGQRGQVRCQTVAGPIQEVMQARRRQGRQGSESAQFVRVGGRWYRDHAWGGTPAVQPGMQITIAQAVLGELQRPIRIAGLADDPASTAAAADSV